jgi:hypothetical protein
MTDFEYQRTLVIGVIIGASVCILGFSMVAYLKPKKKGQFSKQSVVFLDVESAFFWKNVIESRGCKQVEVLPVF